MMIQATTSVGTSKYELRPIEIPSKPVLSEDLNALINTLIKFVAFFLPYFLTVNIFWYREPPLVTFAAISRKTQETTTSSRTT